jgi:antitoxin PrlF
MTETAKVTSKNQITLPANVRKALGVSAGDKLDFIPDSSGGFNLRARKGVFADLIGLFADAKPVSGNDITQMVESARKGIAKEAWDAGD